MSDERKTAGPDGVLAAEYVLGVLPHAERQAFAARLENDPVLQEEVRFWSEKLSPLASEVEPAEPPATVLGSVESRLFGSAAGKAGWWSSLAFWRGLAVASLAALVVVAVYAVNLPGTAPSKPAFVAEIAGESGAVTLIALYEPDTGLLKLNRTEGAPLTGRDFELWLIGGGDNPISLGVLPAANRTEITVPETMRGRFAGAVLAVSDEPEGGSPTGQPTGAVLATGAVAEI